MSWSWSWSISSGLCCCGPFLGLHPWIRHPGLYPWSPASGSLLFIHEDQHPGHIHEVQHPGLYPWSPASGSLSMKSSIRVFIHEVRQTSAMESPRQGTLRCFSRQAFLSGIIWFWPTFIHPLMTSHETSGCVLTWTISCPQANSNLAVSCPKVNSSWTIHEYNKQYFISPPEEYSTYKTPGVPVSYTRPWWLSIIIPYCLTHFIYWFIHLVKHNLLHVSLCNFLLVL